MAVLGNCRLMQLQFVIEILAWKKGFLVISPVPYGAIIAPYVRQHVIALVPCWSSISDLAFGCTLELRMVMEVFAL
jgi:hypothetical protein